MASDDTGTGAPPIEPSTSEVAQKARRKRTVRIIQIVVSLAIAVAIFVFLIPKIASYRDVWTALRAMTLFEVATLLGITLINVATYWPQMTAALPGLKLRQAAVVNQASTAVANTIPGGGVIAIGVTYTMLRSWGFSDSSIALMVSTTGIWNVFLKLALPLLALVVLFLTGDYQDQFLIPSLIGIAALGALVTVGGLMLWKESLARGIGGGLGRVYSAMRRWFRRPPVHWGDAGVRFRNQTIELVKERWLFLSITTLVSHVALYLVLLTALRHVGVSEQEVSWSQVLAVYAFVRLLSAVPLTPGGVGFVELGYVGALVLAARGKMDVPKEVFDAQVTAAVLVFRTLTYGLQIPSGALCYLFWLKNRSWRRPVATLPEADLAARPAPSG